jgi:uncharacterized MnhB-related membrane protein
MNLEFLIANTLVVLLMVIASLVAVLLRDLLAAAVALAAMSLLLSLEFYLLQAPDVAIAQAGVGACLTTAIVIITIKGTMERRNDMEKRIIAGALVLSVVAVFFFFSIFMLHPFGEPGQVPMDDYIITHTQNETGTNNGVTSVVFDYRGFDTLGEATILFSAVTGVLLIFRRVKR